MKLRIAIWTGVGALVVAFWSLYFSVTSTTPLGIGWAVVYLTCPIALARHHSLSVYFVLLTNAATYALLGSVVETMRQHYQFRLISN
jgi:hypothetical protein